MGISETHYKTSMTSMDHFLGAKEPLLEIWKTMTDATADEACLALTTETPSCNAHKLA